MIGVVKAPAAAAVVAVALFAGARPGAQTVVREEQIALDGGGGSVTGTLVVPATPRRPALVLIVGAADAASKTLATALAADGIASVGVRPGSDTGQTRVRPVSDPYSSGTSAGARLRPLSRISRSIRSATAGATPSGPSAS